MPNWKKVIVSGSDAALNSLNVATNVVAQSFTGSLFGTSSNVQGGTQYYIPVWNTNTSLTSSYLYQSGSILKTIYSGQDRGLTLDYNFNSFILGNAGVGNNTYLQVFDGGSTINIYSPNYTYFNDKVGIRIIPTNLGLAVSGALEVTGPGPSKFMNTNVQIDGNLFMSGSNRLIYNDSTTNSMLFGMFDGSNIYGPYYQIFGNQYSNVTQRGSAEFVYDNRNNGGSGFNIASFNGSTWTRKFRVDDNGAQVTGSLEVTNGITGSLYGTASWALNVISASYTLTSSYALSASYAATSSFADRTTQIDVYVKNMSGAQINKGTVVRIVGAVGDNPLIATASYTNDNNSANTLGITTQDIANGGFGYIISEGVLIGIDTSTPGWSAGQLLYLGANGAITGSAPVAPLHAVRLGEVLRVQQNNGSMYVRIDNGYELGELHDVKDTTTTGSYGDLLVKSGSIWINSKQLTGSYGLTGSLQATSFVGPLQGTASWAVNSQTSSHAVSFTVENNAVVSGSLTILQNLTVLGSASITHISESTLNIGTNLITVNTNTPSVRFGGLAVIDSGSSPISSGSFLFDSVQDEFIFVHKGDGTNVTSSHFIMGPETFNDLGNETYLTLNRIPKSRGNEHLNDSQISDDGTTVSIPGKLVVTGSITGSLFGTSSWASNASTASNATVFTISSSLYSAQGATATAGTTVIASIPTSSYRAGFFDYTVYNVGNARAGIVMSAWNGSSVQFTDTSTTDIGATNSVTMSVALNGGNVELRTTAGTTWTVRTTYRLI